MINFFGKHVGQSFQKPNQIDQIKQSLEKNKTKKLDPIYQR